MRSVFGRSGTRMSCPNNPRSSRPVGIAAQIELHEGTLPAPTVIVNCTRDQLLPRTRLTQQQHRGIGWRDRLHQFENVLEGQAISDDLLEVLAANFFFEIQFFLHQFVFELGDLAIAECVFNQNSSWYCYLTREQERQDQLGS